MIIVKGINYKQGTVKKIQDYNQRERQEIEIKESKMITNLKKKILSVKQRKSVKWIQSHNHDKRTTFLSWTHKNHYMNA